jgi:Transglycosylase SLT domain
MARIPLRITQALPTIPDFKPRNKWRPLKSPWVIGGGIIAALLLRKLYVAMKDKAVTNADPVVEAMPPTAGVRSLNPLTSWDLTRAEQQAFKAALPPQGQEFGDLILAAAREYRIAPFIIAGIMQVETMYGKSGACKGKNAACVGFTGGDFGLMQINKASFPDFFTKTTPNGTPYWADAKQNIRMGASILKANLDALTSDGGGTVRMTGRAVTLCVALPGRKPDPRPIANPNLISLGVAAAYNAGLGNVLAALAVDCNPDTVTFTGGYAKSAVKAARDLAQATVQLLAGAV